MVGVGACSQQKNTVIHRSYHNLTSHYNGFFNGRLALQDAHRKMKEGYAEDYTNTLPIFIYSKAEVVQPVYPELDRAIAKTSLVIDRHSMDIKGKEYCKWIDDTWLVMGEAQFLKGEYTQAKQIFDFTKRKYPDEAVKQLSHFWLARIYAAQEDYSRANDALRKVSLEEGFPEKQLSELHAFKADLFLRQGKREDAITELERSVALTKKRDVKTRRMFILAQLYKQEGDGVTSSNLYAEVLKRQPDYEMAFYAKINRALAYDVTAGNADEIRSILFKMLKDEKNAEFLDQIYYALAEMELKEDDEPQAIEYLKLATRKSVKNGNTKGLAFYKLGEIYFSHKNYTTAQAYYDSTTVFLSTEHPDYNMILARANSLTQMVRDMEIVAREDSLQAFAKLPEKEQERMIERMIEDVKQQEIEAERQKQLEEIQSQQAKFDQGSQINKNITKGEWYFYNPAAVGFGAAEFKKIWGTRKNEDNWRRSDKTSLAPLLVSEEGLDELPEDTLDGATDPKNPNYYRKDVPDTDEKLARSNALIIEALYDLGMVYKEQMNDQKMAAATFEDLLSRYDTSRYHANVHYQLYLMYGEQGNQAKSDYYKRLVLENYPETDYAKVILNPDYASQEVAKEEAVQDLYGRAYAYFSKGFYRQAYELVTEGIAKFMGSDYEPQLKFLEALCLGYIESEARMIQALEQVEKDYGGHEVGKEAGEILAYFRNGKKINSTVEETTAEMEAKEAESAKEKYTYDIGASHNFILIVPDTANMNALQVQVSDFNRKFFSTKGFKTSMIPLQNGKSMIIVSNVGIAPRAMDYYGTFKNATSDLQQILDRNYLFFVISYDNYALFYKDPNTDGYLSFFQEHYMKTN